MTATLARVDLDDKLVVDRPQHVAEARVVQGQPCVVQHVAGPQGDKHQSSKAEEVAEAFAALSVDRAVMVGDRRFDLEGARANGLQSIGVLWGIGERPELVDAGADRLIERPDQLPDAVTELLAATD